MKVTNIKQQNKETTLQSLSTWIKHAPKEDIAKILAYRFKQLTKTLEV